MEWHEYSEWAIAEHLSRHSYYYSPNSKRVLVTAAKMRKRILEICQYNAKKPIKERRHGFKDKVAFVLENGGTDLLEGDFLNREEYDKKTFSECRLNKYVSEGDGPASARSDARPEGEGAEEVNGNDTSETDRHVVVGQERCASETASPSKQSTLPSPLRHVSAPLQTSGNSRTGLTLELGNNHEEYEQNGTDRDEQLTLPRGEGRQVRSSDSIAPQTQTPSTSNGTWYVSEEADAASSGNNSRPHNESVPRAKRKHT